MAWGRSSRKADQHVFRQLAAALPAYDGIELHGMRAWHNGEDEIIMFQQAELTLTRYRELRIGGWAPHSPLEQSDAPAVPVWPIAPLTTTDPAFSYGANDEHGAALIEEAEHDGDHDSVM